MATTIKTYKLLGHEVWRVEIDNPDSQPVHWVGDSTVGETIGFPRVRDVPQWEPGWDGG